MNRYFVIISLSLFSFNKGHDPKGWSKIGTEKLNGQSFDVYFFDYFSKVQELEPDIRKYKGFEFTSKLEDVEFKFPLYVFKSTQSDFSAYYILRPDPDKRGTPFIFRIDIVKTKDVFELNSLEDRNNYAASISKTIDDKKCRGELIYEYSQVIQRNPNKDKLIGNGIAITDSVFTRVIPYKETKAQFLSSIQTAM